MEISKKTIKRFYKQMNEAELEREGRFSVHGFINEQQYRDSYTKCWQSYFRSEHTDSLFLLETIEGWSKNSNVKLWLLCDLVSEHMYLVKFGLFSVKIELIAYFDDVEKAWLLRDNAMKYDCDTMKRIFREEKEYILKRINSLDKH